MSKVGIIMGSDSDIPVMKDATEMLDELQISYEVTISSAHRTPDDTADWAREARDRGVEVIIAGAGASAALPGVGAAYTELPVIGVPLKAWAFDGMDALLSIAQMPPGVPVATVGVNGAKNGALMAARIMAASDEGLRDHLREYGEKQASVVRQKNARLQENGMGEY